MDFIVFYSTHKNTFIQVIILMKNKREFDINCAVVIHTHTHTLSKRTCRALTDRCNKIKCKTKQRG